MSDTPDILFHATIVPRRSLSRRGWTIVLGSLAALGALAVLRFALLDLWPIIGCIAAEAGLVALLLLVHARAGRASEVLLLEPGRLRVLRTDPAGRHSARDLPAGWLNPVLEETPGRVPRLLLVSHGRCEEVAAALGETEKRALAAALAGALRRMREPQFDNPQLRD